MAYGTQIGCRIASIGVAGTDRLVHFMSGPAPSWDTDNAWCHAVPYARFPGQLASEVNFRDGTSTVGGMSFELIASSALSNGTTVAQMLYDLSPVEIASIDAGFLYSATTVNLDDQTLAGQEIFVAQTGEVIRLGTHAGAGVYNGCTRGLWGTRAQTVLAGYEEYGTPSVYDPTTGPVVEWRRIEFIRVNMDTATGYSDVETLWTGVVSPSGIARPKPGLITIDAESLLGVLQGRKILTKPWAVTLDPPHTQVTSPSGTGGDTRPTSNVWTATGETDQAPTTTTGVLLSVDGEQVARVASVSQVGSIGPYRGTFDEEDLYEIAPNQPGWPDDARRGWECHHLNGTTDNALPYSKNLLTALLQCLLTTREGNNHATYDLGGDVTGDEDLGLGVAADLVDVSAVERVRSRLGRRLVQTRNFFNLEKPDGVEVLKWFGERLWPYGIVLTQRGNVLSVALLDDSPQLVVASLTEAEDVLGPSSTPERPEPSHVRRGDLPFDSIRAEFAFVPGNGVRSDTFINATRRKTHPYADQEAPLGVFHGVESDRAVQEACTLAMLRFHDPLGEATFYVRRTSGAEIDAGDLVSVTHASLPSSQLGARGVDSVAFLVTSKEEDHATNTTTLRALDVGSLYGNTGFIAPAMVCKTYAGSGAQVVMEVSRAGSGNGFQSGELDDAPEDASDIAAGDVFDHCDEHGALIEAGLIVLNVATGGVVDFTTTPATAPTPGDLFLPADYDNASARQQARYAYLADSNGQLGAGNAAGQQYTAY